MKEPLEKQNNFKIVPIDMLIDNPNNPNHMSKSSFAKLVRNIEHTGLYEPIIVRKRDSDSSSLYEIINGHQRVRALKQLGYTSVDVCVWDIDDEQVDIFAATLNRLSGKDMLENKLALLKRLSEQSDAKKLAEVLPLTSGQIERYRNLSLPREPAKQELPFDEPLIFFVNKKQRQIIENAIQKIRNTNKKSPARATKAQAITQVAETFIENNKEV